MSAIGRVESVGTSPLEQRAVGSAANRTAGANFAAELTGAMRDTQRVKFSGHALQRMRDRNIHLTDADHARIARSIDEAQAKGARETLLLMGRLAMIVGVPNRTVITVMEPSEGADAVFTNIDTVVVVGRAQDSAPNGGKTGRDPIGDALMLSND